VIRTGTQTAIVTAPLETAVTTTDWRTALPVLQAAAVTLRELRLSDAATLLEMLSTEEVSRFISPPPTTVEGFERFIAWTHRERSAGRYICFGIVPDGFEHAVGIIQVRTLGAGFDIAEWGFAVGSSFWGTGVFQSAAREVVGFAFNEVGVQRLEARSAVANGRGNGALLKLGATREGLLRKSFLRNGTYHDQVIWSICSDDWREWQRVPASRPN
jgi:[ribosomal protein S5]-alanine N-acetyltransferase